MTRQLFRFLFYLHFLLLDQEQGDQIGRLSGDCFTLGVFLKITEVAKFILFPNVPVLYLFGQSGHPVAGSRTG
jgi:hypothetical protein